MKNAFFFDRVVCNSAVFVYLLSIKNDFYVLKTCCRKPLLSLHFAFHCRYCFFFLNIKSDGFATKLQIQSRSNNPFAMVFG